MILVLRSRFLDSEDMQVSRLTKLTCELISVVCLASTDHFFYSSTMIILMLNLLELFDPAFVFYMCEVGAFGIHATITAEAG